MNLFRFEVMKSKEYIFLDYMYSLHFFKIVPIKENKGDFFIYLIDYCYDFKNEKISEYDKKIRINTELTMFGYNWGLFSKIIVA